MLVKTNKDQSIITKKFNPMFREKVTTDCCDPNESVADTKISKYQNTKISKLFGVKFRKTPRNINCSTFRPV